MVQYFNQLIKCLNIQSGIGTGYLQRTCIDPLDPHCPKTAPNFYNSCDAILHLERNLTKQNSTLLEFLSPFTASMNFERNPHQPTSALDILGALCYFLFFSQNNFSFSVLSNQQILVNKTNDELTSEDTCKKYRGPFLQWMILKWKLAKQYFPSNV